MLEVVTLLHSPVVKFGVVVGGTSRQSIDSSQEFPSFCRSQFRRATEHGLGQIHVFVLFHLGKCFRHLGVDRFRHQSEDLACNAFGTRAIDGDGQGVLHSIPINHRITSFVELDPRKEFAEQEIQVAQVFLGHRIPLLLVFVVGEHLDVRLQMGLRRGHIDGCLLIQIYVIRQTIVVHGLVMATNPQTTLLHHAHPLSSKVTHRHEHHGVGWAVGHTVSFHVEEGLELGTICLVHGLVANIVHQGMHRHFTHWATKCFTQIGDHVLGGLAVFLPCTHAFQSANHGRLSQHLHEFCFAMVQGLGVDLDAHGLSQAQHPHLVAITGLVVEIHCRFSRQQSLTYQLAGLRTERT